MRWSLLSCLAPVCAVLNVSDKIDILNVFNAARCTVTAPRTTSMYAPPPVLLPPMYWDMELEDLAQKYVDSCPGENTDTVCQGKAPAMCSSYTGFGSLYYAFGGAGNYSAAQLVTFWIGPKDKWSYGTYLGNSTSKEQCGYSSCATYTQVIAAATTRVGCALNTNPCTGTCPYPTWTNCLSQFICFFNPQGNQLDKPPYQAGVLADVNPPQACQSVNATGLDVLPMGACALAIPKEFNTTCGPKVNASQTCVIACATGWVPIVAKTANATLSCGLGVLSPVVSTLSLCKRPTNSASSASVHVLAVVVFLSFLF